MLHGTLPRAYLPPGLSYFGGYYGEDFTHPGFTHVALENPYTRHQQLVQNPWQPVPLDLSLKPSSTDESEAIEVDDEEDRKDRVQKRLENKIFSQEKVFSLENKIFSEDETMQVEVQDHLDLTKPGTLLDLPLKHKYQQFPTQKMVLTSPQSSYQQFLLSPQQNHHLHSIHAPMTPPSTPSPPQCPKRKSKDEDVQPEIASPKQTSIPTVEKITKTKKKHVARRLKFDEDTSSPVSGTVILGPDEAVVTGDIDPAFNVVEVTEEARAELAKIENRLGPYQCKLCRQLYEDAFQLAQHRCSRIAHVEYRCPECDKRFSCPANLASHRRWHKPRVTTGGSEAGALAPNNAAGEIACTKCEAKFSRQAALKKHMSVQHSEANNNDNSNVNKNDSQDGLEKMVQQMQNNEAA